MRNYRRADKTAQDRPLIELRSQIRFNENENGYTLMPNLELRCEPDSE